jgi:hypothetical protein
MSSSEKMMQRPSLRPMPSLRAVCRITVSETGKITPTRSRARLYTGNGDRASDISIGIQVRLHLHNGEDWQRRQVESTKRASPFARATWRTEIRLDFSAGRLGRRPCRRTDDRRPSMSEQLSARMSDRLPRARRRVGFGRPLRLAPGCCIDSIHGVKSPAFPSASARRGLLRFGLPLERRLVRAVPSSEALSKTTACPVALQPKPQWPASPLEACAHRPSDRNPLPAGRDPSFFV